MPTYEVVRGDTVWGLTRRALTEQLGRVPTNREILEVVNQVSVPSGNVDLIFPGEQITIPVGPAYQQPAAGGRAGDQRPDSPQGVRPQPGRPDGGIYTGIDSPAERRAGAGAGGVSPADRAGAWTSGRTPSAPGGSMDNLNTAEDRLNFLFGGPGGAALAGGPGSMPMPNLAQMSEQERNEYMALQALQGAGMAAGLGGLYAAGGGGAAPAVAARTPFPTQASVAASRNPIPVSTSLNRAPSALPSGARPALPSGARPALPAGPAPARPPFPTQASVAAGRNALPVSTSLGFRIPPNAPAGAFGAIERRLLMGPGGYAY